MAFAKPKYEKSQVNRAGEILVSDSSSSSDLTDMDKWVWAYEVLSNWRACHDLLQSFKVRLQAKGKGSAQANINMGTFEDERFPFPSVIEQRRIVKKLDSFREETQRLASLYERKLAALDALKKSLLHQAFSGAL